MLVSTTFLVLCTLASCQVLCTMLLCGAAADFSLLSVAFWSIRLLSGGQKLIQSFDIYLVSTVASWQRKESFHLTRGHSVIKYLPSNLLKTNVYLNFSWRGVSVIGLWIWEFAIAGFLHVYILGENIYLQTRATLHIIPLSLTSIAKLKHIPEQGNFSDPFHPP